jgi:low affinity Fe/Cu permease
VDEVDDHVSPIGAKGFGEIGITGAAAAIGNAGFHATGKRVRDLPITLDKLLSRTTIERMTTSNTWFAKMAQKAAKATGSSPAFLTVCLLTLVWLASGPVFHWSDTWQLVINTVSNIVAMLMLFLIQNTQNRESAALQLKADELLRAMRGAQNAFINLEELSEEDLDRIKERYARMAELARAKAGMTTSPDPTPDLPK